MKQRESIEQIRSTSAFNKGLITVSQTSDCVRSIAEAEQ
jgi:hypothetical protein